MRTLDRMLRIIYKEMPLYEYVNNDQNMFSKDLDRNWEACFNLERDYFLKILKQCYLSVYPNNYNEDELDLVIKNICGNLDKRYTQHLCTNTASLFLYIVDKLLFLRGGDICVSFDDLLEWNGFINKVDSNILIAAKLALESGIRLFDHHRIEHDNPRLLNILSRGISENHMHLKGSGYTTEMNWYEFSNSGEIALFEFEKILENRRTLIKSKEVISFYKIRFVKMYLFSHLIAKCELNAEEYTEVELSQPFMKNFLSFTELETYQELFSRNKEKLDFWRKLFKKKYCLAMDEDRKYFLSERLFLKDLFLEFRYDRMDAFSLYLFNVYLLASSKFKMFFYQDNEAMGFEKFKHSEEIKENLIEHYKNIDVFTTVFDKYYSEKNVKMIEFRVAAKGEVSKYVQLIKDIEAAEIKTRKKLGISDDKQIKYGFIVHYIKDKDEFNDEEGISRKEKMYFKLERESDALISFFDITSRSNLPKSYLNDPYRRKIVGIDTANYEINCRPEYFGYSYRKQKKQISSSHRLRFTYHVGEDFTTLANGLRAIDEVIEFLNFSRGDRLGHGLALGLDVDSYFQTKRNILVSSVEEYLDDLVWMRYFIANEDISELNGVIKDKKYHVEDILRFLEQEFLEYFKLNYAANDSQQYDIYDYYCGYRLRGDDPRVYVEIYDMYLDRKKCNCYDEESFYRDVVFYYKEKLNFENPNHKNAFLNDKGRDLFFRYHYSAVFKKLHNRIINIYVNDLYIEAVRVVQYALKKKLYHLEIAIESNPSSNIKISSVFRYIDLPFFKLNQSYKEDKEKYNLFTSINTDDSSIFQTDLSLEYAYVVASLLREGCDVERTYEFIEYMRNNSMIQSFVNESIT